jgi:hypothetical protein
MTVRRRIVANLRARDWIATAIELAIVILSVFIGIEAANWNQARQQRNETASLLFSLKVEMGPMRTCSTVRTDTTP